MLRKTRLVPFAALLVASVRAALPPRRRTHPRTRAPETLAPPRIPAAANNPCAAKNPCGASNPVRPKTHALPRLRRGSKIPAPRRTPAPGRRRARASSSIHPPCGGEARAGSKERAITHPPRSFPPKRDASVRDAVARGRKVFRSIGCVSCHPGTHHPGDSSGHNGRETPGSGSHAHRRGGAFSASEPRGRGGERRAVQRLCATDVLGNPPMNPTPGNTGPRSLLVSLSPARYEPMLAWGGEAQDVHEDGTTRRRKRKPRRSRAENPCGDAPRRQDPPPADRESACPITLCGAKSVRASKPASGRNPPAAKTPAQRKIHVRPKTLAPQEIMET